MVVVQDVVRLWLSLVGMVGMVGRVGMSLVGMVGAQVWVFFSERDKIYEHIDLSFSAIFHNKNITVFSTARKITVSVSQCITVSQRLGCSCGGCGNGGSCGCGCSWLVGWLVGCCCSGSSGCNWLVGCGC